MSLGGFKVSESRPDLRVCEWQEHVLGEARRIRTDPCNDLTSIARFEIDKSPDSLSNVRSAVSYSMSRDVDIDVQ
jgi:hypothetical protein